MSVLRIGAIMIAVLVLSFTAQVEALAPPSPSTPPSASAPPDPNQLFQAFNAAWEADEFASAVESGDQLIALPIFAAQSDGLKYSVLSRLGYAHRRLDATEIALELWAQAETMTSNPAWLNYMRVYAYRSLEDWDQAFERLALLQTQDEDMFDAIQLNIMFAIVDGLEDTGKTVHQRRLLELMVSAYDPESPLTSLDFARLRLARIAAREGDLDTAALLAGQINRSQALASLRTERIFEPLWSRAGFMEMTQLAAALESELHQARAVAAAQPDQLEALTSQIRSLMALGRTPEAETVARQADARLRAGEAFLDADEQAPWLLNDWSYTLYSLGRFEEADATLRRAGNLTEGGTANVSQTINLAAMLIAQQRPAEALNVIAVMSGRSASPYGDMWAWEVQACAHHQLGDFDARDPVLATMAEHWADNAGAYQKALLCVGQTEAAVALLVRRLEDPEHASSALTALQRYRSAFTAPGMELAADWAAQFDALAHHPDVAAALEPVGRIETSEIVDAYWGNF